MQVVTCGVDGAADAGVVDERWVEKRCRASLVFDPHLDRVILVRHNALVIGNKIIAEFDDRGDDRFSVDFAFDDEA